MTRQELFELLKSDITEPKEKLSSVNYLLREIDGTERIIYFFPFEDAFLESLVEVRCFEMQAGEIDAFVKEKYENPDDFDVMEYEASMHRGNSIMRLNAYNSPHGLRTVL